jgi:Cdc6-like AAA superfamily ATPase
MDRAAFFEEAFPKYTEEQLADIIARCEYVLERFATGDRWEAHRVNAAARKRRAEAELRLRALA